MPGTEEPPGAAGGAPAVGHAAVARPALAAIGTAAFLAGAGLGAWQPFASIFLTSRGLSAGDIGLAAAAAAVGYLVGVPIWGHVADTRLGRPRALAVGALSAGVVALAMLTALPPLALGLLFALLGAATASWLLFTDAITVNAVRDARGYARIRLLTSVAYAVASIVAGWVVTATTIGAPLTLLAGIGVALAAITVRLPDAGRADLDALEGHPPRRGRLGSVSAAFHVSHGLPWVLIATVALFFGHQAGQTFLGLQILDLGGDPSEVALNTAISAAAEIPAFLLLGRLVPRMGLRGVFALSALLYGGALAVWSVTGSVEVVLASRILTGVAYAGMVSAGALTMRVLLPAELQGTGQGLYQVACFGISSVILGLVAGPIHAAAGYTGLFALSAGLAGLAAIVGWLAFPARTVSVSASAP